MANPESLGKQGVPFRMDIERGKIHEFARAVLSGHPAFTEGEQPVVPPTFLTSMFFWEERVEGADPWPLVAMDQRRGMHAEQEFVFFGPPPRAGAKLTARSRIAEFYDKAGKRGGKLTFVVKVTDFFDEAGTKVAEARMTGVETEKPPESAG
jgi:hypothetical protein